MYQFSHPTPYQSNPNSKQPKPIKIRCLSDLQSKIPKQIFQPYNILHLKFFQQSTCIQNKPSATIFKNNPQGILQIFTYQYLILCYEQIKQKYKREDQTKYLQSLFQLIQKPQFQLMKPNTNPPAHTHTHTHTNTMENNPISICTQQNLKNILSQFINYMIQNNTKYTVIELINKFPLIMDIFVSMLRGLLYLGDLCINYQEYLNIQKVYDFLASYFSVQASIDTNNNCVCFHQTGIYVYQIRYDQVYMIYVENNGNIGNIGNQKSNYCHQTQFQFQSAKKLKCQVPQIELQQFSSFQRKNQTQYLSQTNQNQVTLLVSNIDIQQQQQNTNNNTNGNGNNGNNEIIPNQYKYKIAASQFVKDVQNSMPMPTPITYNHQNNFDHEKDNTNHKKSFTTDQGKQKVSSIATTYSSFRKNSISANLTPSVLQSQFVDTMNFGQLKDNQNFQKYKNQRIIQQKQKKKKYQSYLAKQLQGNNNYQENQNIPKERRKQSQQIKKQKLDQYVNTAQTFYVPEHAKPRPMTQIYKPVPWFNKNISKQFTNSILLQCMPEPYRSGVRAAKARARQARRNIYGINF